MSFLVIIGLMLAGSPAAQPANPDLPAPPVTYGSAVIEAIHTVEGDYTLLCDIAEFPPVIGRRIPVRIRGLDAPADNPNPLVLQYLQEILVNRSNEPNTPPVLLHAIQRGPTFCLVADVEVDGEDLGMLLVEKGLVRRVFEVPAPELPEAPAADPLQPETRRPAVIKAAAPREPAETGFVASRTGKVFHRPDCSHAKRIAEDRKVTFATRQQAEASGRRPCKTCSP